MILGSFISKADQVTLITADGIKKEFSNTSITSLGFKVFGIPHMGLRMRARVILDLLDIREGDAFFDAGCGIGVYSFSLASMFSRGLGLDLDREKVHIAQGYKIMLKDNHINCTVGSLEDVPLKNECMDKVLCSEVIEHIQDDKKCLQELYRILKKNGRLVLTTTSIGETTIDKQEDFDHARPGYKLEELKNLLEGEKFHVEKIVPYGLFWGRLAWKINRYFFHSNILTALTFYPLYFLSFFDSFVSQNGECIGYIVKAKK